MTLTFLIFILSIHSEDVIISPQCADVLLIGGGIAGAVLAEAIFPLIVEDVMGFTLGGVLAESFATEWQAGIGDVAEGSIFSKLQSLSAGGAKGDQVASVVKLSITVLSAPLALLCNDLCPAIDKSLVDISLVMDQSGQVVRVAWNDLKNGTKQTWDRIEKHSKDAWREVESGTVSVLRNIEDDIYWMWYKSDEKNPSSDSTKFLNLLQVEKSSIQEESIMLHLFYVILFCLFFFTLYYSYFMGKSFRQALHLREYEPLLSHMEHGICAA